jgi:hypothetical protein
MDNVVLIIPGEVSESMLVSAHFDTVSLSPGATDNSAAVSVLLEAISALSARFDASAQKPYYTLVCAFVQGEEIGLLGAAALAEFWPPFLNVTHFLNLDGTPGDKSMNFRSSGGLLNLLYAHVPYPLGFATAMDIFNLKLIGSDTDWTVYNRYRSGLDYATFSKRQTYHTLKDTVITPGSIQFLGENVLSLVAQTISQKHDLWNVNLRDPHIFFSILNRWHIVYSTEMAGTIHALATSALGCLLIASIYRSHFGTHSSQRNLNPSQTNGSSESVLKTIGLGLLGTLLTLISTILVSSSFSFVSSLYAQMYSYTRVSYAVVSITFPSLTGITLAQWIITYLEGDEILVETSRKRSFFGLCSFWLLIGVSTLKYADKIGSIYFLTLYIASATVALALFGFLDFSGIISSRVSSYHGSASNPRRGRKHIVVSSEEDMDSETPNSETKEDVRNQRASVPSSDHSMGTSRAKIAWMVIFVLGFCPTLFLFEIMVPLMELAIGALGAFVFGPLISTIIFLSVSWLMPATRSDWSLSSASTRRKSRTSYGYLCLVFFLLSLAVFVPITLHGRTHFNENYPFVFEPRQVDDQLELRPYFPYSVSLLEMANILDGSLLWQCEQKVCRAPNAPKTISKFEAKCDLPGHVDIMISTPGAWMHNITFMVPEGVELTRIVLNGIDMASLSRNFDLEPFAAPHLLAEQPFRFYLNSTAHTNAWTISYDYKVLETCNESFDGKAPQLHVESLWAEVSSIPKIREWIFERPRSQNHVMYSEETIQTHLPKWMSFVGHGMRGLASATQKISPCQ